MQKNLASQYVLEGSVRTSGDKVRVTAQLIDAVNGQHIWAENYDRHFEDFFQLQDEISMRVVTSLQIELTDGEQARIWQSKYYTNQDIFLKHIQAQSYWGKGTLEGRERYGQLAQEIVDIAPESPIGYRLLGWYHRALAESGKDRKENIKKAFEFAQKSLSIDDTESHSHSLLGSLYYLKGDYEKAIVSCKRAIELEPNASQVHYIFGSMLSYMGRVDEAIARLKHAIRLNPIPEWYYNWALGRCYVQKRQYEAALVEYKKASQLAPTSWITHLTLATTYALLDREEEAKTSALKSLQFNPNYSVAHYLKTSRFKNQSDTELFADAMRKAGFPEYPPGNEPPKKPSIAVLPFDNLSDDPEQEYFSDGMTDELIGDLAKIDGLFVISRNSTFTYKGKAVKIQQVAQELNVRYVLEGSVQRSGNKVRIRAQLIDGKTDHHIWSDSYDGVMDDIFELQDEITGKIVAELAVKLTEDEKTGVTIKSTDNLHAYEEYLKGLTQSRRWTPNSFSMAIHHFERAIEIDPNYSDAYAMLGYTYNYATMFGGAEYIKAIGKNRFLIRVLARHYLERGLENPNFRAYSGLALMDLMMRRFETAKVNAKKAVLLAPNDADALRDMGQVLLMSGDPEAMKYFRKSAEADPLNPVSAGIAFLMAKNGQYEESLKWTEKSLSDNPYLLWCSAFSAISHAHLGNKAEAMAALKQLYSVLNSRDDIQLIQRVYNTWPFKNIDDFEWFINGLRLAGVQFSGNQSYYKVEKENRLTGEEIKDLFWGHTQEYDHLGYDQVRVRISKNGDADYLFIKKGHEDKGRARIEGDSLCYKFDNTYNGIRYCRDLYRNPDGDKLHLSEYLSVSDRWIFPVAITE
jgi:TolB-like protein/Flp pilus assembly protein TadD